MLKKIFLFSFLLTNYAYGFISIEPLVPGEKEEITGEVAIGSKYSAGNTNATSLGLGGKIEYTQEDWLLYLLAAQSYQETDSQRDQNNGHLHFRYLQNLNSTLYSYELFFQTEFDEFQDIKQRNLLGANIRKKLELPFDKFYVGLGVFYSYIEPSSVNALDPIRKDIYGNSYISFLKKINENFFITYLGYYQPNSEDLSDFRISQTVQLNTSITKQFTLGLDISHNYNSKPYKQIEKSDTESMVNLKYKF
ncbi:MAG: Unknown protein [uncultured Sulfurovum sp.]|uniref:DUF481 domain-containing protein n=1 Tax=uncultured Sulfurovum sp. TaxID=269237 RepID=A0A6S6T604_9BACT|nr:MAG: Unknown protein [uncultured Sulfurovum sp.]